MTPQEVLVKAAAAIAEHGHIKGGYGSIHSGFCAVGAIRYAACGGTLLSKVHDANADEVVQAAELLLVEELEGSGEYRWAPSVEVVVPLFNDANATTAEDVMLMMKRAAHT